MKALFSSEGEQETISEEQSSTSMVERQHDKRGRRDSRRGVRSSTPPIHESVIVARSVSVMGSVHASGSAEVNIRKLCSWNKKRTEPPIQVRGSVHGVGQTDVSVDTAAGIPANAVPEPADNGDNFENYMEARLSRKGESVRVGTLIIVENDSPEQLKALGKRYGTVYDEVRLKGSVHESGSIEVRIDDCYVVD